MDTNLVLRSGSTHLTGDETLTAVEVGPMVHPLVLHVQVPVAPSGSLDVELEFGDAASFTEIDNANFKQITVAGHYSMPFFTWHKYLQVKLNNSGSVDFDHVKVWIDNAHRYDTPYNA